MELLGYLPEVPLAWLKEISILRSFLAIHQEVERLEDLYMKSDPKKFANEINKLKKYDIFNKYADIKFSKEDRAIRKRPLVT